MNSLNVSFRTADRNLTLHQVVYVNFVTWPDRSLIFQMETLYVFPDIPVLCVSLHMVRLVEIDIAYGDMVYWYLGQPVAHNWNPNHARANA